MFLASFQTTVNAALQIFVLGVLGFFLVRKNILGDSGLDALSNLTIGVTLPILIFCQLIKDFSFNIYPDWWIFPILSAIITVFGLAVGGIFSGFIRGHQHRLQFISLVGFQNSGYLPLVLIAALLTGDKLNTMLIYLFLFLLGFNLAMFSLGVYLLTYTKADKFELKNLINPPVVATLISLAAVFLGLNKYVPEFAFKPLKMIGDCTMPLAMLVVGGNLAQIKLGHINKKAIFFTGLAKLFILPFFGIILIAWCRVPDLVGLLIVLELAVPSATTLSVIIRHYKKEDLLISQGIFFSHIFSLLTIPLFLSLYFIIASIK